MSININIKNARKLYGDNVIIPDLSVQIRNGEFFTLLGPSGCGKTTLLRMIAGFNTIEGGEFYFNDTKINDLEPSKRKIGMVFQNYAIFPNMSVRKNVEFGLKYNNTDKSEIKQQAEYFMKLVHVDQYADRMPDQLSGGQQQRIALARALVIKPDVLLMDEPLSNLDAKLRVEMRAVIKEIQHEVGITTVYVTHDQEEAMAISDRIAVMKEGIIHQCATPQSIYQRPSDLFVATFIGKSNILDANLKKINSVYCLDFDNGYSFESEHIDNGLAKEHESKKVKVSVRPEDFEVREIDDKAECKGLCGVIDDSVFLGLNTHYFVTLENGEKIEVIQVSRINSIIQPNTNVELLIDADKANIYDYQSEQSLMKDVQQDLAIEGDQS